jgi:D-alanyl-D-alanine carboxypeptidase
MARVRVRSEAAGCRRLRTAALCLLAAWSIGWVASPAPAAASAGTGPGSEGQPTAAQVAAGRQRAAALHSAAGRQAATVAQARAQMLAAAVDSALALESYSSASQLRDQAELEQNRQEHALTEAATAVDRQRSGLGRWARQAYVDGVAMDSSPTVVTLLSGGNTDDVATTKTWLERAGRSRSARIAGLQQALQEQRTATDRAQRAAGVAEATAAQADAAKAARDAALQAQRDQLVSLESVLAGTRDAAADADADATRMARAWTARAPAAGDSTAGAGNRVTGAVGDCPGGPTELYPNGRIPAGALCPVRGPRGGLLRADAAFAFNQLSVAFEHRFGQPICAGDTYRSYDEQVAVRARRPGLAAAPGTSNHGWGRAADLCGGIQDFDSPTHAWMLLNAPLYGWFHPAWAERTGPMPEPWHWEFGG